MLALDLGFKAILIASETVHNRFPPRYKDIVHEKVLHSIKRAGGKKETGAQSKTVREMSQLVETNCTGGGRKELFKETCKR